MYGTVVHQSVLPRLRAACSDVALRLTLPKAAAEAVAWLAKRRPGKAADLGGAKIKNNCGDFLGGHMTFGFVCGTESNFSALAPLSGQMPFVQAPFLS